ncbi:unnamed protein product, partial [Effrenium voratum]
APLPGQPPAQQPLTPGHSAQLTAGGGRGGVGRALGRSARGTPGALRQRCHRLHSCRRLRPPPGRRVHRIRRDGAGPGWRSDRVAQFLAHSDRTGHHADAAAGRVLAAAAAALCRLFASRLLRHGGGDFCSAARAAANYAADGAVAHGSAATNGVADGTNFAERAAALPASDGADGASDVAPVDAA